MYTKSNSVVTDTLATWAVSLAQDERREGAVLALNPVSVRPGTVASCSFPAWGRCPWGAGGPSRDESSEGADPQVRASGPCLAVSWVGVAASGVARPRDPWGEQRGTGVGEDAGVEWPWQPGTWPGDSGSPPGMKKKTSVYLYLNFRPLVWLYYRVGSLRLAHGMCKCTAGMYKELIMYSISYMYL